MADTELELTIKTAVGRNEGTKVGVGLEGAEEGREGIEVGLLEGIEEGATVGLMVGVQGKRSRDGEQL